MRITKRPATTARHPRRARLRRPHRPGGAGRGDQRHQLRRELAQPRSQGGLREDPRRRSEQTRRRLSRALPRRADLPARAHRRGAGRDRASRSSCASTAPTSSVLRDKADAGRTTRCAGSTASSTCAPSSRSTSRTSRSGRTSPKAAPLRSEAGRHPPRGGDAWSPATRSATCTGTARCYDVIALEHARARGSNVAEHPQTADRHARRRPRALWPTSPTVEIAADPQPDPARERLAPHRRGAERRRAATSARSSRDVKDRLAEVRFPHEYHAEVLGEYAERAGRRRAACSTSGWPRRSASCCCCRRAFGSWRLAACSFLTLPSALVGGVLAAFAAGGVISLGLAGRLPDRVRHRRPQRHPADQPLPASRAGGRRAVRAGAGSARRARAAVADPDDGACHRHSRWCRW